VGFLQVWIMREFIPPRRFQWYSTPSRGEAYYGQTLRAIEQLGTARTRTGDPSRSQCLFSRPSGRLPGFRSSPAGWWSVGSLARPASRHFLPPQRSLKRALIIARSFLSRRKCEVGQRASGRRSPYPSLYLRAIPTTI